MTDFRQNVYDATNEIILALDAVKDEDIEKLIEDILSARKVFFVGVGRVLLSLQGMCKRFAHLGIDAHCVGDITEPCLTDADLLIVGSGSGNTLFPVAIAKKAKSVGAKVVHIGSNQNGDVKSYTDYMVRIPTRTKFYLEDEIDSKQIMTSLFEQCLLILGDTIAKTIVNKKNLDMKALWEFHANME